MNFGGQYLTIRQLKQAGFKHFGDNIQISSKACIYGTENVKLGNNVRIDDFTVIVAVNGPLILGDYVTIQNYCFLGCKKGITMQDFSVVSPGVKIFSSSDDYLGTYLTGSMVPRHMTGTDNGSVTLEKHVIVGAQSVILPNCTLHEGVSVGALSLVKTDLEAWSVYAGVPVKKIKERKKELLRLEKKIAGGKLRHHAS